MKKKLPILTSDEEAEDFAANSDLTEYDLSGLVPVRLSSNGKTAPSTSACRHRYWTPSRIVRKAPASPTVASSEWRSNVRSSSRDLHRLGLSIILSLIPSVTAAPASAQIALRCSAFLHLGDGSWRAFEAGDFFGPSGVVHVDVGETVRPTQRSAKGELARALNGLCEGR